MSDMFEIGTNERFYEDPEPGNQGKGFRTHALMNSGENAEITVTPNGMVIGVMDHYELKYDCLQFSREAARELARWITEALDSHPGTGLIDDTPPPPADTSEGAER